MSISIVIRPPNHLGDCVMALPMINETGEAYPGSSVSVLVPENLACLYENNAAVDNILPIPSGHVHGTLAVFRIKEILAPHQFDIGYVLPPSFGAAAGFKLAGVRRRIGYIADGRRLLLSSPLPLPAPLSSTHRSELYFDLLRRGSGQDLEYSKPKLFLHDDDTNAATEILASFGISIETPFAVIAFRAVAESRRWGVANYVELCKELIRDKGFSIVLIGSADDFREGEEIASVAGTGGVANLAGKTNLRETAAVISRAEVFIGNDSGPAHLAAAVGAPLVVLSGADDPKVTSPISSRKRLVRCEQLDCLGCVKNVCPLKGEDQMACMKSITAKSVVEQIGLLL